MSRNSMQFNPQKTNRRRGISRWWHRYEWPVVIGLGVVALVLGYIGFAKLSLRVGEERSALDVFYLSVQLFILESGSMVGPKTWELEIARFLAPGLALYTAVQALMAIFRDQLDSLRLRRMRNHVVICGLGRRGSLLAGRFLACGERVVVIERDPSNEMIQRIREQGAMVLTADAADEDTLRMSGVRNARYLIAITGDDGGNAEIAAHARSLGRGRKSGTLNCFIHVFDPRLCSLLSQHELCSERTASFRLEFFNSYDTAARAILSEFSPFKDTVSPHLVLVGAGKMGRSVIVQAARRWDMNRRGSEDRLRITIVDRHADERVSMLRLRHPGIEKACELIPCSMDIESPEFEGAPFLTGRSVTAVYICVDDNTLGLTAGLILVSKVSGIPVVVRMTDGSGLASLVDGRIGGEYRDLHAFSMPDRTCRPEVVIHGMRETLARAIHEAYVRSQAEQGHTPATNPSMAAWNELPESLRESNRCQADDIGTKLRAVGCTIEPLTDWDAEVFAFNQEEIEKLARMEHDRWMADLLDDGWRYAPGIKDQQRKTHPCLVPWEKLTEEVREIDRDTIRSLPAFLAGVGFGIRRISS